MASAIASGFPLASPSLHLPNSQNRQVSAKGVHGAVNCLVQKSNLGDGFPKTSIQRRAKAASTSDKIYKPKVVAGAESNADLEGGDSEKESSLISQTQRQSELKRRELLWAATGTFSYLSSAGLAQSAPVPPSDLDIKHCSPVNLITPGQTETCCLPDATGLTPIQFKFEHDLPMRTRKPAHILSKDPEYVRKYNEAYRRMKALPDSDPRSFLNQWHIHCAFCNGAYLEPGNTSGLPLQYHFSWTFLPWHRMYLYFHERILGELIGDPSFALPFWNWDNQRPEGGNQMPRMFADDLGSTNDELRNAIRDPAHFPPAYVNMADVNTGDLNDIIRGNLSIVYKGVVAPTSPALFFGGPYRANQDEAPNSPGSVETNGHNAIHVWTGSQNNPLYPDNQDMGVFIYAGRDPIFYSHHSNVDRLWAVWKTLPADKSTRRGRRRRHEFLKPDFKNTQFAFYDQHKRLVHCTIRDSIDMTKLRYGYQAMPSDSDWINFTTRSSGAPKPSQSDIEPFARTTPVLASDESRTFLLTRRNPSDDETTAHDDEQLTPEDLEETLVVKGVQVPKRRFMAFRVFINMPDADHKTPLDIYEFAGMITHLAHGGKHAHSTSGLDFRLSIGTTMNNLKLPVGESVSVTFVPQNQKEDVAFNGVESEWR